MKTFEEHYLNTDAAWTTRLPTKAGTYEWRKNWQWESKARVVFNSVDRDCLVTYSERYDQSVPLIQIFGEWLVTDLNKA